MIQSSILAIIPRQGSQTSSDPDTTVLIWPDRAFPNFLILVVLIVLLVSYWRWSQPCDTCGEFRDQCRCKAPEYPE